jgi:hypothetical protein
MCVDWQNILPMVCRQIVRWKCPREIPHRITSLVWFVSLLVSLPVVRALLAIVVIMLGAGGLVLERREARLSHT